jgi:hypothetical protein
LISDIKEGTQNEGVREQGYERVKRDEVTGGRIKLHNPRLILFAKTDQIEEDEMG